MVVDTAALNEHVNHRTVPIYPPIARAARVQGAVVFEIEVGATGKIESMKVVSGPPMLQQAAIDCLKQWSFHPFEKDGIPVAATGDLSIDFTLDEESAPNSEAKSAKFNSSLQRCRSAIQERKDTALAASLCQQAANLAESLIPERVSSPDEEIAKRNALVMAAQALSQNGNLAEAQSYADKAVAIVSEGYDFDSDCVWAFSRRAEIEIQREQFEAADQDLVFAVNRQRHFFEMEEKFPSEILTTTKRGLAALLRARAENLMRLNRSDEAKGLLQEAAKYE
jgi:TonB family protein